MTMYKKRPGTSGIRGHLYETKLTSLIYFRAKHNDHIEEFHLATNVDKIGAFDDICFKAKLKDFDKPVAVFIQAKHRENNKILNNRKDLTKLFNSYMTIRRAFEPNKKDVLFEGNFNETECFFVWYTNEKGDCNCNCTYNGSYAHILNNIIGTGDSGTQPSYKPEDVQFLYKLILTEQITELGVHIAKFICDEADCEMSMNDDLILRFHVILAQKVLEVSEIQPEGYRIASFRHEFFDSNEELLVLLKKILCAEVSRKKLDDVDINAELSKYLQKPTDSNALSKLIGKILIYRNDTLELVNKITTDEGIKQQLHNVQVSEKTVHEAVDIAARDTLTSRKLKVLKVPAAFGNKDLTIRGNEAKVEKRLNHITKTLVALMEKSKPHNVVTIDDSLEKGFLHLNGGIGGTIGNMLVFDDDTTFLKFTNNSEYLGDISKRLYIKLKTKIEDLQEYRFKVNVKNFPRLSLDSCEHEHNITKDFLDKLLFYTNQANENGVEEIFKTEIESQQTHDVNNLQIKSDAIFLKYHNEIQKWWMNPEEASYLTKRSVMYENTLNTIIEETFTHFNELCAGIEESGTDETPQSEGSVLSNKSEDETVTKKSKRPWKSASSYFPAKLRNKLKEIAAAVIEPNRSSSRNTEKEEKLKVVVAIYPFKAKESDELSLETGADYKIIDNSQSCWWQVKDKHGTIGFIPRICVIDKELMEYLEYEWFVGEMSKQRAEDLLTRPDTMDGCFLVRYSLIKAALTLTISVFSKAQQQTLHYVIQQNSRGEFYLMKRRCFPRILDLIKYYKYNDDISPRLTTASSLAKWDIDPSQLDLLETIDEGDTCRKVRRGVWRDYIEATVKTWTVESVGKDGSVADLDNETNIMTKLRHPHIVQLYGMCYKDRPIYTVTEYMRHGTLFNYIKNSGITNRGKLLDMCIQVCEGMTYLVQNSCIHRDVATSSCFLGNNNIVKLGNFCKARFAFEDQYIATTGKVRVRWCAPEVINKTMFSSKSDVWAFGVLMWELFSGCEIPYEDKMNNEVRDVVRTKGSTLEQPDNCPSEVFEVICACWSFAPSDRPSFTALLNRLKSVALIVQGQVSGVHGEPSQTPHRHSF